MVRTRGLHPRDKVADYQARGWWTDEVLDEVYLARVAERGDALALVDPANRVDLDGAPPRRLTWRELDDEVHHLAARLLELGLRRGDVLAVQQPNTVELVETYLAAWLLGVVVTPLAVPYREHELVSMVGRAEASVLLVAPRCGERDLLADAQDAVRTLPLVRHLATLASAPAGHRTPAAADATEPVRRLVTAPASPADRAAVAAHRAETGRHDPDDAMTICWTSGTEAEPKGVPRTHLEWLAGSWAGVDAPQLTQGDVILNPFPLVNMAAFVGLLLPWLRTGCVLVQHHPFDLPTFLGQVATERVSYTVMPPALLTVLLHNEQLLAQADLSSLTRVGSGSAPLPPSMVAGWQERGVGVINFFGSNEGVGLLSSPADLPDPQERARFFPNFAVPGPPGHRWSSRIGDWVQVRLVDLATGEDVTTPGVPAELRVDGPTVFPGYLGDETGSAFDERGWLRTGDLFEIAGDHGQFLRYVDRARDVVIRGGHNIAPAEVEALVATHPAVAEVAVVGDPDEVLGERLAAVVALRPGATLTLEEVRAHLETQHVARVKLPERLEVVDALPRNPVGKVLKRQLRRTAAAPPLTS
ncbi:class I adenylate-forming enzyme family protein [Lapillicoccus jejuensis]|uniref:Acyl-CoA synthetase (AMP-forming)/AMP-acid ligase II n=1 Tax=Lapillicoccus jejuensis TaxID=402171 RepID=A0A542DYR2_9MICO|nr:class I adenylate-forming enzyme family protein [Lapillicoccus jejuensis]TQJ08218.1 acyl-CoA synthetase (AMP-forming)/AMP-acid ligase II [Lapillicoccus jejuensis]